MSEYQTVLFEESGDHVASVTINRPEAMNSFNRQMMEDFRAIWRRVIETDSIHTVVLRAAMESRAFSPGVDVRKGGNVLGSEDLWAQTDPGESLGPKSNKCWKPVVCAVHGMCAGGAFYWLNESDIIICSEDAEFFDPHVTYGMTAALEPIGMSYRLPLGEVLRIALLGNDERVGAQTALRIGLVSEIVARKDLWEHAHKLASRIAAKPPAATQGTTRAIWESLDQLRTPALQTALKYCQLGNAVGVPQVDRNAIMSKAKSFTVR
ncbi:MAG: enoyl-CoA hydratase/isomerase family protein [Alphaproteobacteria bacterium]|nr:enoyl-CoA hydratase/isomerase family protein [Alphaproteobacteria bacterium]